MRESIRRPIQIGLVQIENIFCGQRYLPLSIGLLEAYARSNLALPSAFDFLVPLIHRQPVEAAVEQLSSTDVVLFSAYIWNMRLSLAIARALKAQRPEVVVVFGGRHVPVRGEAFLRANPFVDLICRNEGERAVCPLLARVSDRCWDHVPSISYLDATGAFIENPRAPLIQDLDEIPSPYLEGVFDPLMAAFPNERWYALWETNRGCPHTCTFCDWGAETANRIHQYSLERLSAEIDWFAAHEIEFIFCCDANFGILGRDLDIARRLADAKTLHGFPRTVSVQNVIGPEERTFQIGSTLTQAGLSTSVQLALQSSDVRTLRTMGRRNVSEATFRKLQRRFAQENIATHTDLILGMPDETYDSLLEGVSRVMTLGQHSRIQFQNLIVLPNATIGDPDFQDKHKLDRVRTPIVGIQSGTGTPDGITETQELVIATRTLSRDEWVRARAFCWMTSLLYFHRLLQIPIAVLHGASGMSFRELLEAFCWPDHPTIYPVFDRLNRFFGKEALRIQAGGAEYGASDMLPGLHLAADDLQAVELRTRGQLEALHDEAEGILSDLTPQNCSDMPVWLLHEAVCLSKAITTSTLDTRKGLDLSYNVWDFYLGVIEGKSVPIEKGRYCHRIDRGLPYRRSVRVTKEPLSG